MNQFRLHFVSAAGPHIHGERISYSIDINAETYRQANLIGERMEAQGGLANHTSYIRCEELFPMPHGEVRMH